MLDVMLDLETLGIGPGCSVLSIGAMPFDHVGKFIGPGFYRVISRASCLGFGLVEDPNTLKWWEEQSETARDILNPPVLDVEDLFTVLRDLGGFLSDISPIDGVRVWGNGADFDNAILAHCYRTIGLPVPWPHKGNRCYRTLKALCPNVPKPEAEGVPHHALDDARNQARHAVACLRSLMGTVDA